jgi:uncharacterized membrane protein YfcA
VNRIATEVFLLLFILFLATLVRSTLGFGEALVAVPLLALCIPLKVAAPLAVLVSITIAAIVVAQDWKHIHLRSAGWLIAATIFGIPFGILLLQHVHPRAIKAALALAILAFAAYALTRKYPPAQPQNSPPTREPRRWLIVFGFFAGVMGGAFGMNGPPLVLYGSLRRWSTQQFRATLQAYFLPASILGMAGYWRAGLWTHAVSRDYLLSLPVILPTVWLGSILHRRIPARAFQQAIYFGLCGVGILLLLQAIHP